MKLKENLNTPLSPSEKATISANNLTLSMLSSQYSQTKNKALNHQGKILQRNQFYRVLVNLVLDKAVEYNLSPLETLKSCTVHSKNFKDYLEFDLLLKEEVRQLYHRHKVKEAHEILENNEQQCNHCKEIKSLSKYYPDKRKLTKVEGTCKSCRLIALKKKRAYDKERL